MKKKLTVRAQGFTKSAIQKIEAAGGKVENLSAVAEDKAEEN